MNGLNFTLKEWEDGLRQKTLELFEEHEYGVRPDKCNERVEFIASDEELDGGVLKRKITARYGKHDMLFYGFRPLGKNNGKTFILLLHAYSEEKGNIYEELQDFYLCPVGDIISRGYCVIALSSKSVALDEKGGEHSGIFKEMETERTANSWGVLSAWAWAMQRAADFVLSSADYGHTLAAIGHSRGGKTALLAGAYDQRFSLVISNNSGNSGAALSRGNKVGAETIKIITGAFPYWFCENYKKYADREDELPFDQHLFLSLIAPRALYVASASEDLWADPDGELSSARLAGQVYEKYGKSGVIVPDEIKHNTPYHEGSIAYHRREGAHDLTPYDWKNYMDYFDKI